MSPSSIIPILSRIAMYLLSLERVIPISFNLGHFIRDRKRLICSCSFILDSGMGLKPTGQNGSRVAVIVFTFCVVFVWLTAVIACSRKVATIIIMSCCVVVFIVYFLKSPILKRVSSVVWHLSKLATVHQK